MRSAIFAVLSRLGLTRESWSNRPMSGRDSTPSETPATPPAPARREYTPPKLERLGTIDELTQGAGNNNQFDGSHPPGQNKSIF